MTKNEEKTYDILLLDIETAPSISYTWGYYNQNLGHDMILDYGGYIMSCGLKWLGEDEVTYFENRTKDDKKIVEIILSYLDLADYVVAHNGGRFDFPYIKTRAIINGLKPPSPYKVIDTLAIAKKEMKFKRNNLSFLAEALNVQRKSDHAKFKGILLWSECMNGNEEAWKEMKHYNITDVEVLEQVYLKLRSWSSTHPNINKKTKVTEVCCPVCGSSNLGTRGYYTTNKGKYRRYSCKDCGAWSSSTFTLNEKADRKNLLVSR